MGSYTEFFASNEPSLARVGVFLDDAAPYLLVKYRLPVVWLALFGVDDMQVFWDLDDPETRHVHLASSKAPALARLAGRRDWLLARSPGLRQEWLLQFEAWLADSPYAYLHLATDDVAGMVYDADEWAIELPLILGMFDEPVVPPPPPAPTHTGMRRILAWWRGVSPSEPRAATGWDGYARHFLVSDEGPPQAWQFLGASGGDRPAPWETSV